MSVLLWLQERENATLMLALIGAVNGTLGLMISFLNRHDAIGRAQREQAQSAPWAALRIESGDHVACMVRATFFNPSNLAFVVTRATIEKPAGREIILMHPDPRDLLGPLIPDLKRAGPAAALNWTVTATPETPEKPSFHDEFIVAEPRWSPETRRRWRPATRMRETVLAIRFTGHTLSAAREPIDMLVKASN